MCIFPVSPRMCVTHLDFHLSQKHNIEILEIMPFSTNELFFPTEKWVKRGIVKEMYPCLLIEAHRYLLLFQSVVFLSDSEWELAWNN